MEDCRAALIVNTGSRRGAGAFAQVPPLLEQAGITVEQVTRADTVDAMLAGVRQALDAAIPLVIVGGGDGSISTVIDLLVGRDATFAVLPTGTANSFARSLGLPLDLPGAVAAIARGRSRRLSLGRIDRDCFANFASIGLAPLISESIPHRLKAVLGKAGYAFWAAVTAARFKPFTLVIDGQRIAATEVRIANGGFQGGTELVEEADPGKPEIDVQVVLGRTRWSLLRSYAATLLRRPRSARRVRHFCGREFRLETVPPLPISIDGEVCARTPVTVSIVPEAVRVIVP